LKYRVGEVWHFLNRVSKNAKISKNRLPGVCRGPEDVDFIDPTALDPGLVVTPEWLYPGRGDGVFFNTQLSKGSEAVNW
jgi:hypothetical protein